VTKHITAHLATLKAAAESGVDYSPRTGALCPGCGQRTRPHKTLPWDGNIRIRYHRCDAEGCLLAAMGQSFKSVEVDQVGS